jgi:PBSX family phage portal protein
MAVRHKSAVHLVRLKRAADTLAVVHPSWELEDEFSSFYNRLVGGNVILEPTFNPLQLMSLAFRNSTLMQCIHAMEVNIDGTGYTLELKNEDTTDDEKEKDRLEAFFDEPFPGLSFVTIRRKLRVEMEQVGYGFLEVIVNPVGDVIFLRNLDVATVRLVQYDQPVQVDKEIVRNGETVKAKFWVRERRFVQKIGQKLIYFREYGSTRELDREKGTWGGEGTAAIPLELRASQVLMFIVDHDPISPYGVPRWINNTPSVLGGRKSEEMNLDFFDSGGLPPAIIFIQGGSLTKPMEEQLLHYLGGGAKTKNRAAVVAVQSASGSLETPGKVDVRVERFGDSRQSDSLFQQYEENSEERIRAAFRMPPIFLGKAQDYSFASAMTSYKVAEAQVFNPERIEFDEIINHTILRGLKAETYKFQSKPIFLRDVQIQLEALLGAAEKIDGEDFIITLNDLTGLNLTFSQEMQDAADAAAAAAAASLQGAPGPQGNPEEDGEPVPEGGGAGKPPRANIRRAAKKIRAMKSIKSAQRLLELAEKWVLAAGLENGPKMDETERAAVLTQVELLRPEETVLFNRMIAARTYSESLHDPAGLGEITGCARNVLGLH